MKDTMTVIYEQMQTDDENPKKQNRHLRNAYDNGSIDDFLIALCGRSWDTIQKMRGH